jgi:hypothetical protein
MAKEQGKALVTVEGAECGFEEIAKASFSKEERLWQSKKSDQQVRKKAPEG